MEYPVPTRRIVREDWYWGTIRKIAEKRFRKRETKADLLLELDLRAKACCEYFSKDPISCRDCFKLKEKQNENTSNVSRDG